MFSKYIVLCIRKKCYIYSNLSGFRIDRGVVLTLVRGKKSVCDIKIEGIAMTTYDWFPECLY